MPEESRTLKEWLRAHWLVATAALLYVATLVGYFWWFGVEHGYELSSAPRHWAYFSAFMGLFSPLFALLAAFIFNQNLVQQRVALESAKSQHDAAQDRANKEHQQASLIRTAEHLSQQIERELEQRYPFDFIGGKNPHGWSVAEALAGKTFARLNGTDRNRANLATIDVLLCAFQDVIDDYVKAEGEKMVAIAYKRPHEWVKHSLQCVQKSWQQSAYPPDEFKCLSYEPRVP